MPLNLHTLKESGVLYIVATPIGNMDDMTIRAIHTLGAVDLVAAEDTRKTGQLLSHHKIKNSLIAYHEHNEQAQTPNLVKKLKNGHAIALVSDAGTPSISDPGYRLVKEAVKNEITVIPIPGVSAAITALSAAGLPTDAFVFVGFLPKKKGGRHRRLKELAEETRTIIIYESPKRLSALLEEIKTIMGDRYAVLGREMTKRYEEFVRGCVSEICDQLKERPVIKGECTLVVSGKIGDGTASMEVVRQEITTALEKQEKSPSDLSKDLAKKHNISRKSVYDEILKIKEGII